MNRQETVSSQTILCIFVLNVARVNNPTQQIKGVKLAHNKVRMHTHVNLDLHPRV